ncbi:hypothetical protein GCM10027521_03120 [Amycolatopsis cihanbeyliensis]
MLQPRGGPEHNGPRNFRVSVRQGVQLSDHSAALGNDRAALTDLYPDGIARLWGSTPAANKSNAKAVALRDRKVGDRVLFYADKAFFAEATILHLFYNPTLAESVWGTDEDGSTWEHVMALGDVREFESPIPAAQVLGPLGMTATLRSLTLVPTEKYAVVRELITSTQGRQPRYWLLHCNPKTWDVWSWWEERTTSLNTWTVARHLEDLRVGDPFALWVSGSAAGIYALGALASEPYVTQEFDDHWAERPKRRHVVDLRFDRFIFDEPLTKRALAGDPVFADALVMRMPGSPNPIPLTPEQWETITRTAGVRGRKERVAPSETVVTSRPVGDVPERTTANGQSGPRVVDFREAKLVKWYTDTLGRELRCLSALLPSGERLVCDLFDPETNTLIEAKASNERSDVRLALGQLLDYQHHIKPDAELAVLLPVPPSASVAEVLHAHDVTVISRDGRTAPRDS